MMFCNLSIKIKVLTFVSALSLTLVSWSASANMTKFLDEYEQIVAAYEQYANQEKFCIDDLMELNADVIPKLLPLAQKAQTLQDKLSTIELQRYMSVMNRYSNALVKLAPKMNNVTC